MKAKLELLDTMNEKERKAIVDLALQGIMLDYHAEPNGVAVDGVNLSPVATAMYDTIIGAQSLNEVDETIHRIMRAFHRHFPQEAKKLNIDNTQNQVA